MLHEICWLVESPPEGCPPSVMRTMSDASTARRSASAMANESPAQPTLRATRYECQNCHAHTFLVLRTIGEAKCSICESCDLKPVRTEPRGSCNSR
jgi:hypothetical protein